MSSSFWFFLGIFLLALGLDVGFIYWWRKRRAHRAPAPIPPPPRLLRVTTKVQTGETALESHQGTAPRIVLLHPVEAQPPARAIPTLAGDGVVRVHEKVVRRLLDTLVSIRRMRWLSSGLCVSKPVRLVTLPRSLTRPDILAFSLALTLYLATRLIGLTPSPYVGAGYYPIYFHGDEAIHTVYASELIRDGGMFEKTTFLPTYFKNGSKYNLSLSVYLQVLPTLLFGKSVMVTRATSILLTLIPAAAVAFIVRDFLKLPYSWTATLLLSLVPAWFLHSRTAFETVLSVSMYAGFLYYYLRYRLDNPKNLYPALAFGALTFYAYSPAQLVIVACGFILLLADLRYHLKHWQTGVRGLGLLLILALPYIRFRLSVSAPIEEHLRDLGSYWLAPIPLAEKLSRFASIYLYGLSPGYWYFPNIQDLPRHQMGQYGHILRITLPFALVGLLIALRSVVTTSVVPQQLKSFLKISNPQSFDSTQDRSPISLTYRTLLFALLIAPLPGTLAQVGITRVLTFILPITILTAVGLITCLRWLETRWPPPPEIRPILAPGLFALLGLGLGFFTAIALRNGPYWHQDYGFGGMQYGAQQVFDKIKDYLDMYNSVQIVLTPDWANGSDELAEFFLEDPFAIEMASLESFLIQKRNLAQNHLVVLTAYEYELARVSNKLKAVEVEETLPYPNGEPGFYFVQLTYVDDIEALLASEREAQMALRETTIQFEGVPVFVRHSGLDIGTVENAFDQNDTTLLRTDRVNPFVVELTLPVSRQVHGVSVNLGAAKILLTVQLFPDPNGEPVEFSAEAQTILEGPIVIMDFGQTVSAQVIRIEVLLLEDTEFAHVHIWEIRLW